MASQRTPCLTCRSAGRRKKPSKGVRIVFDPRIQIPGTPTIEGHRLAAEQVATLLFEQGVREIEAWWDYLTREEILAACWWASQWGPRRFKVAWAAWGVEAGIHLWSSCINVPYPPTRAELAAAARS